MNSTTKIIIAIVAVGAVVSGAVLLAGNKSSNTTNTNTNEGTSNTPSTSSNSGNSGNNQSNETTVTITYSNNGFDADSVTVPSGSTLRIVNNSSDVIKPSSDPHPDHTDNPQLNFPEIDPGKSASVTLTAKGTWGMHDHFNEDHHTTVVVQ